MRIYLAQSSPHGVGGVYHTGEWMKIYLADAGHIIQPIQMRLLVSYHYYTNTDFNAAIRKYFPQCPPDIFADSGAFSAMTQGAPIDIDQYAKWVKQWQNLFTVYCNLDVIGDTEQTDYNQKYLEDTYGLTPLPVFHVGSDFKHLEDLVSRYDYIALGGMVPHLRFTDRIMRWLIQCFKIAGDDAVFHGLGATNWTVIKSLKWYSVDSSAWGQGFRYGAVPIWDAQPAKFKKLQLGNKRQAIQLRKQLSDLNLTPDQFYDRDKNTRQVNAYAAAMSYIKAEQWLTARFGHSKIYLAETATSLPSTLGHAETQGRIHDNT